MLLLGSLASDLKFTQDFLNTLEGVLSFKCGRNSNTLDIAKTTLRI